jgi:hypothetical protein
MPTRCCSRIIRERPCTVILYLLVASLKVKARVFHSPVLFSLLFSVSLAAVLITHDCEYKEG